jgi:hypothetical protein
MICANYRAVAGRLRRRGKIPLGAVAVERNCCSAKGESGGLALGFTGSRHGEIKAMMRTPASQPTCQAESRPFVRRFACRGAGKRCTAALICLSKLGSDST